MSYISFNYIFFIFGAAILYYLLPKKIRPYAVPAFNLIFYAFSGWKNVVYLAVFCAVTYFAGLLSAKDGKRAKAARILYVILSVGALVTIKFSGYVTGKISALTGVSLLTPELLCPLGLSFFTLQGISYVVDVGKGKHPPERNILYFSGYLTFFPTIVQGPIARYSQTGEQFRSARTFDYYRFKSGAQLALWGFFLKLVIANRAAVFADKVFDSPSAYTGSAVAAGAVMYAVQLYADFSGCVNICRGSAGMLGFDLIGNFDHPYFAVSIRDFWSRWHISLSTWLRDYVYIPLGGNRVGKPRKYLNVFITFVVSGLWHGVGVHYLVWGVYHALLQIIGDILAPLRAKGLGLVRANKECFSFRLGQKIITFAFVTYGWLIFRANSLGDAVRLTKALAVRPFSLTQLDSLLFSDKEFRVFVIATTVLLAVSIMQSRGVKIRETLSRQNLWFRWAVCLAAIFAVIIFGLYGHGFNASDFLYMQY